MMVILNTRAFREYHIDVILSLAKDLFGRTTILQSLRSFRMT